MPVYSTKKLKRMIQRAEPQLEQKMPEPLPEEAPVYKPLKKQVPVVETLTTDNLPEPTEPKINLKQLIKEKLKKLETEEEEKGSGMKSKKIIKKLITGSGLKVIE